MSRPILLLNCGSSSIKYQMIDGDSEQVMAVGLIQKVGDAGGGTLDHEVPTPEGTHEWRVEQVFADHTAGLEAMVRAFAEHGPALAPVVAVAHRTVHGGTSFASTTLIDDAMVAQLKELYGLAPLHNPPGVAGIEAARAALPEVPHVAVFDTAFFADLPDEATSYAIDRATAEQLNIRKYGFHGTSHSFVSKLAADYLGRDLASLKQIVLHLGNGASASAIDAGLPIDTSMGLTPLQGLVMGTRSGDVDPGLFAYLQRAKGWDVAQTDTFLNKQSGMLGLTGKTDMRDVLALIEAGDEQAALARDVYVHRLVSYIGSYTALLGGLDVLVFTAGVGENAAWVREAVLERLAPFGVVLDREANHVRSKNPRTITTPDSSVTVLVVPTNEELAMAREALALIDG